MPQSTTMTRQFVNQTNNHPTTLLGLPIFNQPLSCWRDWLKEVLLGVGQSQKTTRAMTPVLVMTPNAEQLVQAYQNPNFYHDLTQASVLLPDGISLVLASRWFGVGQSIATRLAGADAVVDVLTTANKHQLSVLVVGGKKYGQLNQFGYASVKTTTTVSGKPSQTSLFWTPGYLDIAHPTPTEHATVRFVINHLKPTIVLVAFGAPWQEAWAIRHLELLTSVNTRLVMVVGGAMDFLLGGVPRAPQVLQQWGLEWLFRLILEPWRWQRQLRLVTFWYLAVTGRLKSPPTTALTAQKDARWRD